jgi:glycine betaine/proline transport system substrate-binding protein
LGAAITTLSQQAVNEYGLASLGYTLQAGDQKQWIQTLLKATVEKQWVVFPTWAPQYLNASGIIRPLADSRGILGKTNHGSLVGTVESINALPLETVMVLQRINIGLDGVTEMDRLMNVDRMSPRAAARLWMTRNRDKVDLWLNR